MLPSFNCLECLLWNMILIIYYDNITQRKRVERVRYGLPTSRVSGTVWFGGTGSGRKKTKRRTHGATAGKHEISTEFLSLPLLR